MFWLAIHFPAFPLEIFSRGGAAPEPLAVIEKQGNRSCVKTCNEIASERGVRAGMPGAAAQALVTNLIVRSRDLVAEQESLEGLAAWAGGFTPAVSLQPPDGLLIEIGSCLRLHRGFKNLIAQMRSGLNEMGYSASLACAPTPHAAWLLALAGKEVAIRDPAKLEKFLGALSVKWLAQPQDTLDSLKMLGAHTLGDCLRFPRAGVARRFGQSLLDEVDRTLGRLPEAREFFVPPPSFTRRLELPSLVHEAEALLFASRRLLLELEGYLNLRQAGVQEFELICRHENVPDTILKVGFAQPTRALERMLLLLRETLGRTACVPRFTPSCFIPVSSSLSSYPTWTYSRTTPKQAMATCCWNVCASGLERMQCSVSHPQPTTGPSLHGVHAKQGRQTKRQANFSVRCGCCLRPGHARKNGLNCSPDRSASRAAGGTAGR